MIARNTFTKLLLLSFCICLISAGGPYIPPPSVEETPTQTNQVILYDGEDGGFIECYCNCADTGLYCAENDIYTIGSIRMQGAYDCNGIFQPKGYENQDISTIDCFKFLCNMAFPEGCYGSCWAGGATGTPDDDCGCGCDYPIEGEGYYSTN